MLYEIVYDEFLALDITMPEQRLCAAILYSAIHDAINGKRHARLWIEKDKKFADFFTFSEICDYLRFSDPDSFRLRILSRLPYLATHKKQFRFSRVTASGAVNKKTQLNQY